MAVAAARFRARLAGHTEPAGEQTARMLAGYRRMAGDRDRDRDRGQARAFSAAAWRRPRHVPPPPAAPWRRGAVARHLCHRLLGAPTREARRHVAVNYRQQLAPLGRGENY